MWKLPNHSCKQSRTAAKPIAQQAASPYLKFTNDMSQCGKKKSADEVPQCESKHVLRSKSRDITQTTSKRWGGFTTPDFQISVTLLQICSSFQKHICSSWRKHNRPHKSHLGEIESAESALPNVLQVPDLPERSKRSSLHLEASSLEDLVLQKRTGSKARLKQHDYPMVLSPWVSGQSRIATTSGAMACNHNGDPHFLMVKMALRDPTKQCQH